MYVVRWLLVADSHAQSNRDDKVDAHRAAKR